MESGEPVILVGRGHGLKIPYPGFRRVGQGMDGGRRFYVPSSRDTPCRGREVGVYRVSPNPHSECLLLKEASLVKV